MNETVTALVDLLDIEHLDDALFRGQSPDEFATQRVFGGQVIAQALMAAYRTVDTTDRTCHSLHAYFIRPGDPNVPIIYQVDKSRDGGSFTTRRVVAIQHGRQILNMAASFHVSEEGWDYQHQMPDAPDPDSLTDMVSLRKEQAAVVPERFREHFTRPRAIEMREVDPQDLANPVPKPDSQQMWFRIAEPIADDPVLHHCMLAYATDMALLSTGQRPHGLQWFKSNIMGASLDHAIWFHAPIKFDEWHLYTMDAPWTGSARSFNRGMIFNQQGRLVASVAQEGLMRPLKPKAKS